MENLKLHGGLPPHLGWWLTLIPGVEDQLCWRWLGTGGWSKRIPTDTPAAALESEVQDLEYFIRQPFVYWSYHWPEGARVERMDVQGYIHPGSRELQIDSAGLIMRCCGCGLEHHVTFKAYAGGSELVTDRIGLTARRL